MAYKFQVGSFTASGSIKAESGFDAGDSNIANVGDIDADTISVADAANGLQIQFDGANNGTAIVTLKDNGDNALDFKQGTNSYLKFNTTNSSEAVEIGENVDLASGKALAVDGTVVIDADGAAKVKAAVAGDGLAHSSGVLSVGVDDSSIETNSDVLRVKASGITNAMLAGSIADSKLNVISTAGKVSLDALEIDGASEMGAALVDADLLIVDDGANGTEKSMLASRIPTYVFSKASGDATIASGGAVSLAAAQTNVTSILNSSFGKIGTAANQENIDFGTSNSIIANIDNSAVATITSNGLQMNAGGIVVPAGGEIDTAAEGALLIAGTTATSLVLGKASQEVRVLGNLIVQGTTKSISATTIEVTSSFTFEGSTADGNETTLGVIDPTADRTLNLANVDGTLIPFAAASTTAISSTPGELNLLDGSGKSTSSITVADADAIIIIDGNTTKQIPASDLKTYIGAGTLSVASGSSGAVSTIAKGVNYYDQMGGAATATLTAGSSLTVGDVMYIKAGPDCSSTNTLTVNAAGSDTIDGTEDHFVLESPNAAVTLIYVADGDFRIF